MIWFLIVIAAIIVGFILYEKIFPVLDALGMVMGMVMSSIGIVVFTMLLIVSIINHAFPEMQIANNNIKYEALIERKSFANSEYEDYSKSDVIRDIAEWNAWVNTAKSLADSPWTNIIVSKRVIDELKYID